MNTNTINAVIIEIIMPNGSNGKGSDSHDDHHH